jgi:hypothetical protein
MQTLAFSLTSAFFTVKHLHGFKIHAIFNSNRQRQKILWHINNSISLIKSDVGNGPMMSRQPPVFNWEGATSGRKAELF